MGIDVPFLYELERLWDWDVQGVGGVGSYGARPDWVLGI
jgi:hypothetical protein